MSSGGRSKLARGQEGQHHITRSPCSVSRGVRPWGKRERGGSARSWNGQTHNKYKLVFFWFLLMREHE